MAVSYVAQKCTSCAGTKFDYDKDTKMWKCLYCGAVIERHEQADTMFTIKNVVRQAILDIAYKRMDSAQNNLVECKKIDSRYVGTIIADIAYEMNMIVNGGISKSEQQNYFSMMKKNYSMLRSLGDSPTEEEIALYDFFESSEVTGVLILVFDSINAAARRDALLNYFDPSSVFSMSLNGNLINYALKSGNYEMFNTILHNTDNINKKSVLNSLLSKYPDNGQKGENAVYLFERENDFTDDDQKRYEKYIRESGDSAETKCIIAIELCKKGLRPSVDCLMNSIVNSLQDQELMGQLMSTVIHGELVDVEIATIVEYSLVRCGSDICTEILSMLSDSGKYVEFSADHFTTIIGREDLDDESRKSIISLMMQFEVTDKVKYRVVTEYLCETPDEPEKRMEMISFLLSFVDDLSTNTVEKYILCCGYDKENKPAIVNMLFDLGLNRSFFNNTLSNYILTSKDDFKVKKEIVYSLLERGLRINSKACAEIITDHNIPEQQRVDILRMSKTAGVNYDDVMDMYLLSITPLQFEPEIFGELFPDSTKISTKAFIRYVLDFHDLSAAKIGNVGRMMTMSYQNPANINCSIIAMNDRIECNLIQAYILSTRESPETAQNVLEAMGGNKSTASADIFVSGAKYKIKKYAAMKNKSGELGETSKALCAVCKLL